MPYLIDNEERKVVRLQSFTEKFLSVISLNRRFVRTRWFDIVISLRSSFNKCNSSSYLERKFEHKLKGGII